MTLTRVAIGLTLLATTTLAWAEGSPATGELKPRAMVPKKPSAALVMPEVPTGDITVKFRDEVLARVSFEGKVESRTATAMQSVDDIVAIYELDPRAAFMQDPEVLAQLEARIERYSGRAQPDLAGTVKFRGSPRVLLAAAREFNDLDMVEWVVINGSSEFGSPGTGYVVPHQVAGDSPVLEPVRRRDLITQGRDVVRAARASRINAYIDSHGHGRRVAPAQPVDPSRGQVRVADRSDQVRRGSEGGGGGTDGTGGCCVGGVCTDGLTPDQCIALSGVYTGDGSDCTDPEWCFVGACCLSATSCDAIEKGLCESVSGSYQGVGTTCPEDPEDLCELDDCGTGLSDCFDPDGGPDPYCTDMQCCQDVCEIDPFCCDEEGGGVWDPFCAAIANLTCDAGDRCASPLAGSCYYVHDNAGCQSEGCCNDVGAIDPFCTDPAAGSWDGICVILAYLVCDAAQDPGATPDYEQLQGYAEFLGYGAGQLAVLEDYIPGGLSPIFGFTGEGMEMYGPDFDLDGEPDDPLGGLHGLAMDLYENYDIDATGEGVLTTGNLTRVSVVGFAYHAEHEDIQHVVLEDDQTMIIIDDVTGPDWGTADLSIIGAQDNGIGITGLVPDAELKFYPIVSVEEGPREYTAWINAMLESQPGDIIAGQYFKQGPPYNVNCSEDTWTLIRMASDGGISVVCPVGDNCANMDNQPDLGNSGAATCGALSPGFPWYRLSFSNYSTEPDTGRSNIAHLGAHGASVVAAGFGDLFLGGADPSDRSRVYTASYGGTEAASAQIAGLYAAMQGLAKQFYGISLIPEKVRDPVLGAPGSYPAPTRFFGGFEEPGCSLDFDPDQGPFRGGMLPDVRSAAAELINETVVGFTDSPLVDDIIIVKGDLIYGSKYSVKGSDNNYLVVEGVQLGRGSGGTGPILGQGGHHGTGGFGEGTFGTTNPFTDQLALLQYPGSGNITDVVVIGSADIDAVQSIGFSAELAYPGVFTLVFAEAFDWYNNDWDFVGFGSMPADPGDGVDYLFLLPTFNGKRYVRTDDDRILFRLWTIGLTGPPGGILPDTYRNFIDTIDIAVSAEFGEGLP